jgi:hypothetical protein
MKEKRRMIVGSVYKRHFIGTYFGRMVRISSFVTLLLIGKLAFSQQDASAESTAFGFVDSVFHASTVIFEINELRPPDSILDLMIKFNNAIAANKEWAAEYMNKYYVPGQGTPYNEKFGITKEEYDKVRNAERIPYSLCQVKSEKLLVARENSCISFQGEDSFRILNYLFFCGHSKTVIFGKDTISFAGELTAAASTPFGKWHGYRWLYEKSNQGNDAEIKIHELSSKIIEIDIGRTVPANRYFLRIEYQEVAAGEKKAYMDLMGFLDYSKAR